MQLKEGVKLWDSQIEMIEFANSLFRQRRYAFWHAGCSTGKTLAALILLAQQQFDENRFLVITTKGAIDVWRRQGEQKIDGARILALDGSGHTSTKALEMLAFLREPGANRETRIVVLNYESAARMTPAIIEANFKVAIADESHHLAAHNSMQSVELAISCRAIPYKVIMTGTGWADRPTDVFGQVRWLSPIKNGKTWGSTLFGSWTAFFETYVVYKQVGHQKIPLKYKNIEPIPLKPGEEWPATMPPSLTSMLAPFTYYVKTEDVIDLPEERHDIRYVPMTGELKKLYKKMDREGVAELGEEMLLTQNILSKGLRLHQLTAGIYAPYALDDNGEYIAAGEPKRLTVTGADAKQIALDGLLDEIGRKPTVIFCSFDLEVEGIAETVKARGLKPMYLTGALKQNQAFQDGEGDVMIVNIRAGAEGIDLTRAAYGIFVSVGWSRSKYIQALGRLRRFGSDLTKPVIYYHLIMRDSIDEDMHDALNAKESIDEFIVSRLTNKAKKR